MWLKVLKKFGLLISVGLASPTFATTCDALFKNANVWDGSEFVKKTFYVKNGRFAELPKASAVTFDAGGLYMAPPLVDAHTHTLDTPSSTAPKTYEEAIYSGVFYALNPNNNRPQGADFEASRDQVEVISSGGGLTSKGGHPVPLYNMMVERGWMRDLAADELNGVVFHEVTTLEETKSAVAEVKKNGSQFIKLYLLNHDGDENSGLSAENFIAAVTAAKERGLLALVHIENAADFELAVRQRVHAIMHMPYQLPANDMQAASMTISEEQAKLAAANGVIVVPTLTASVQRALGAEGVRLKRVTDSNLKVLRSADVILAVGADSFGKSMHEEFNLLRDTEIFTEGELLRMATINGLSLIAPHRKVGEFKVGYEASFVAWSKWPGNRFTGFANPVLGLRAGQIVLDVNNRMQGVCD